MPTIKDPPIKKTQNCFVVGQTPVKNHKKVICLPDLGLTVFDHFWAIFSQFLAIKNTKLLSSWLDPGKKITK